MSKANIIHCKNLSKNFNSKTALSKLNFDVEAGDPVALVGPNGAGKTTLLSILSGYIRPSVGQVTLFNNKPGSSKLFGRVSALPQDAQLDPHFSIGKQLSFYAELQGMSRHQASIEASRVLELMRLSEVYNEQPSALSHGMGKRVAIAQALIGNPELVLLDEPTAGLDPANARNIRNIVTELSTSTTFIISSHNLSELERMCKTVLHLDNGSLQIQANDEKTEQSSYLTIHMTDAPNEEFLGTVNRLSGVISVNRRQKNEYIIQYDPLLAVNFDQQLLLCLFENSWNYRQLIKGKTLEEKLFSDV